MWINIKVVYLIKEKVREDYFQMVYKYLHLLPMKDYNINSCVFFSFSSSSLN